MFLFEQFVVNFEQILRPSVLRSQLSQFLRLKKLRFFSGWAMRL